VSTEVTIDLTNYKDRVGQQIKPGRYRVIVDDAELDTSKQGNQMINLWLRVADGPFASAVIIDRLVNTDKSLFRIVAFMQAIGMPTPKKRLRFNVRSFVGKTLEVDVEDGEPYNGRVKSEVRGYMRVEGADAAADDLEDGWVDGSALFPDAPAPAVITDIEQSAVAPNGNGARASEVVDLDTLEL
jgi:Protein of unknown function (DUF669)